MHSSFSDGRLEPDELLLLGATRGLDLLALADHNTAAGARAAMEAWRDGKPGPRPVPAQEVSSDERMHLLVYGLEESLGAVRSVDLPTALGRVEAAGGAAVLAHPWSIIARPRALDLARGLLADGLLHGVELLSAALFYEEFGVWRETLSWYERECASCRPAVLGGTDWHDHGQGYALGLGRTLFLGEEGEGGRSFIRAVRAGETAALLYPPLLLEHGLAGRIRRERQGLLPEPWDGLLGREEILAALRAEIRALAAAFEDAADPVRRAGRVLLAEGRYSAARRMLKKGERA
ncbi:MAG: PHP domain-containing protein [Bacteroidota bacterium]